MSNAKLQLCFNNRNTAAKIYIPNILQTNTISSSKLLTFITTHPSLPIEVTASFVVASLPPPIALFIAEPSLSSALSLTPSLLLLHVVVTAAVIIDVEEVAIVLVEVMVEDDNVEDSIVLLQLLVSVVVVVIPLVVVVAVVVVAVVVVTIVCCAEEDDDRGEDDCE